MNIPTTTLPLNALTPHPENYNTHPASQIKELAESLSTFGQFKNIVTWTCPENMTTPEGHELHEGLTYILAGHGLWLAAMEAGVDELEVKDYSGISYEMAIGLLLVDNAAPLGSEPDAQRLAALLARTREMTADRPGLGAMLERLKERAGINGHQKTEETGPPIDKAAELQKVWGTEVGQIWQLGNHRLIVGDCTDRAMVEAVMRGERARLVVTDPPYGVSYADKNKFLNAISPANRIETPIENDHATKEQTQAMWKAAFSEMSAVMDAGAVVYCFMPQGGDQMMMMMMMMMGAGIEPRHELIWLKNNHVLGRVDYAYKHEPILYAWKDGGHKFYGDFQTSILEYPKPQISDLHPTQKPLALIERLISNSSKPDEVIYDPFTGSGTVIVAGENLGRKVRACELDPGYAAVSIQRWVDLTGQTPRRVSG